MRKSSPRRFEEFEGKHRYEHWYRDNTLYFITSRCRDSFPAFEGANAKDIFWDRFVSYSTKFGFVSWVTTLLDTHYHTIGHLGVGANLGQMMRMLHGSVAKLVNDTLEVRLLPFWREKHDKNYFDGCLRDKTQLIRAYQYTLKQAVRAGIVTDWKHYPHTRVEMELDAGLRFALENKCFLPMVPYKRYNES